MTDNDNRAWKDIMRAMELKGRFGDTEGESVRALLGFVKALFWIGVGFGLALLVSCTQSVEEIADENWGKVQVDWATDPRYGKHFLPKYEGRINPSGTDTTYFVHPPPGFWEDAEDTLTLGVDYRGLTVASGYLPPDFLAKFKDSLASGGVIVAHVYRHGNTGLIFKVSE